MENLDQAIEAYSQRKQQRSNQVTVNTKLNHQIIQAETAATKNRMMQKAIKIRELKNNPVPYLRHMNWLKQAKG